MLRELARQPVADVVETLHTEVRRFLEGVAPDDDISLLGVEYTGPTTNHFAI